MILLPLVLLALGLLGAAGTAAWAGTPPSGPRPRRWPMPHIKAGKMRPLATWGATRLAAFPDVPTLKELGYDVEDYLWAVADPELKAAMDKVQTPIAYQDADEFKAWWDHDARRLADVVTRIGRVESK
jgi:tripartite-type tricarboxylate transporter receptor subunit TctC